MSEWVFATCEGVKKRLRYLRGIKGLRWSQIAKFEPFQGIPIGTLHGIYSGKPIPKKWYGNFGLPRPRRPRISIRLDNPESAARSIKGHMERVLIDALIKLLQEDDHG